MAGDPEIYVSAAVGDNERIVALLAEGEDIDRPDESGNTALMGAEGIHLSTLELLLDRGPDVDAVNDCGWSAVALAYYRESPDAVQRLVDAGADTSLRVTSGALAESESDLCQQARRDNRPAMVEVLCEQARAVAAVLAVVDGLEKAAASEPLEPRTPFFACVAVGAACDGPE